MKDDQDDPAHNGPKRHSQHPTSLLPESSSAVPIIVTSTPDLPAIHLRIHPITHPGAETFTKNVSDIGTVLTDAVKTCWKLLYNNETHLFPSNVRSITIYVRPMGGVAYTTGNWLDGENKEIHVSADYLVRQSASRARDEIRGVLVHEMVHVWQYNGMGTAPGGLIEGIADYVRLRAGFAAPHWKRGRGSRWDEGYDATGYFLDWVEKRNEGFVRGVNAILRDAKWDEGVFKLITGKTVDELWKEYRKDMDSEQKS